MTEFIEVKKRVKGTWGLFGVKGLKIDEHWQKISIEMVDRLKLRERIDGDERVLEFRDYIEPGTRKETDAQIESISRREDLKEIADQTLKNKLKTIKDKEDEEDKANKIIVAGAVKKHDIKKAEEKEAKEQAEKESELEHEASMENSEQDEYGYLKETYGWDQYARGEKIRISKLRNKKLREQNANKKAPAKVKKLNTRTLANRI